MIERYRAKIQIYRVLKLNLKYGLIRIRRENSKFIFDFGKFLKNYRAIIKIFYVFMVVLFENWNIARKFKSLSFLLRRIQIKIVQFNSLQMENRRFYALFSVAWIYRRCCGMTMRIPFYHLFFLGSHNGGLYHCPGRSGNECIGARSAIYHNTCQERSL